MARYNENFFGDGLEEPIPTVTHEAATNAFHEVRRTMPWSRTASTLALATVGGLNHHGAFQVLDKGRAGY